MKPVHFLREWSVVLIGVSWRLELCLQNKFLNFESGKGRDKLTLAIGKHFHYNSQKAQHPSKREAFFLLRTFGTQVPMHPGMTLTWHHPRGGSLGTSSYSTWHIRVSHEQRKQGASDTTLFFPESISGNVHCVSVLYWITHHILSSCIACNMI